MAARQRSAPRPRSSTGAWSFTTADLAAGSYAFTATDTTSAGTSAASSAFDVTVTAPPPAAPVISTGVANSNELVTLTGTAPDGATVTVSDGGGKLGTATAKQHRRLELHHGGLGGWHLRLHRDRYDVGGDQRSVQRVRCDGDAPPPAAPVISSGVANSNEFGDLDRNRTGWCHGDGVGWRRHARHHDREQQHRRLELHHGGLGGWLLRLHRDRYDVGGDQRSVQRVRCDGNFATTRPTRRAGDQQRRGQFQRVGDLDGNRTGLVRR